MYWFKLSPLSEFLVTCQHQATASDLPFNDIFAPTKNSSFEIYDDVIARDLWFGPPPQPKILARPMVSGWLLTVLPRYYPNLLILVSPQCPTLDQR